MHYGSQAQQYDLDNLPINDHLMILFVNLVMG